MKGKRNVHTHLPFLPVEEIKCVHVFLYTFCGHYKIVEQFGIAAIRELCVIRAIFIYRVIRKIRMLFIYM